MQVLAVLLLSCAAPAIAQTSSAIIQRSVTANSRDWAAAPGFSYTETDRGKQGTKTYRATMIDGSPYNELTAVNGEPLAPAQQAQEQAKLRTVTAQRDAETPAQAAQRVAAYRAGRRRDHVLISQLTQAFDFRLAGATQLNGRKVYELQATPRAGYTPPNTDSKVLTGMKGTLWIDAQTYQWAKVEARVTRPVWIAGFLAKVMPGTRFELEYAPAAPGIWLPVHFKENSNARVLFLFNRQGQDDETYSDYRRSSAAVGPRR